MDSCLFGAESSLRLLAGSHQQGAIPQAPEHLRFDSWPRHWAIGLKGAKSYTFLFCEKNRLFFARTVDFSWCKGFFGHPLTCVTYSFIPLKMRNLYSMRAFIVFYNCYSCGFQDLIGLITVFFCGNQRRQKADDAITD